MRITNNIMMLNMMEDLNRNLMKMNKDQRRLSTGKNINSAMDDPVGVSKILKYKSDIAELEQFDRNAKDALAWLEHSESAIMSLGESYSRLSELATQAVNGTYANDDRQHMKSEIEQIKKHIITTANSSFAGRYIFSNFQTDKKLMDKDGNYNNDMHITSYDIENSDTKYQVGVGEQISVNTNGIELFGYVEEDNVITKFMPDASINENDVTMGTPATPKQIVGTIDLEKDYSSEPDIQIKIGTAPNDVTYTVDKTRLNGSKEHPLSKEDVTNAIYNAKNGNSNLRSANVVDVYYTQDDKLAIVTKENGSNAPAISEVIGGIFGTSTGGMDVTASTATGHNVLDDADMAADTNKSKFTITLNGRSETIEIDMSTINNTVDFQSKLQMKLDNKFPKEAGKTTIEVQASHGSTLKFSTKDWKLDANNNVVEDTSSIKQHTLDVRPIKTKKSQVMADLDKLIMALDADDVDTVSNMIDVFTNHNNNLLKHRSSIGARVNRLELTLNRSSDNKLSFTQLLSNVQDADIAEVIMEMRNSENIYRASLQTGAKVIQPSLMDFLR